MRRMDELVRKIYDSELYSDAAGEELVEAKPLADYEARNLFKTVSAKKNGVWRGRHIKGMKRAGFIVAAVIVGLFGLTLGASQAFKIGYELTSGSGAASSQSNQSDTSGQINSGYYDLGGFTALRPDFWNNVKEYAVTPDVKAENGGLTVRIAKLFFEGKTIVARVEIITPYGGAKVDESAIQSAPLFGQISQFSTAMNLRGCSYGTTVDPDPTDNIIPIDVIFVSSSGGGLYPDIQTNNLTLAFSDISYVDASGAKQVKGIWPFSFTITTGNTNFYSTSISNFEGSEKIMLINNKVLTDIGLHPFFMEIGYQITKTNLSQGEGLPETAIVMKDGTASKAQIVAESYEPTALENGYKKYIMIDRPVDPRQVKYVMVGSVKIPFSYY